MTTTAQSFHSFEAHPTDEAMEIHPENEYDMGDEDIDLDLDPTYGNQQPEDDVLSLQDAETDAALETQAVSGDRDDFMVDKEDVIEEDEIDFDEIDFDDVGQPTLPNTTQSPAPLVGQTDHLNAKNMEKSTVQQDIVEEDLIDYSDDEGEQPQVAAPEEHQQLLSGENVGEVEGQEYQDDGENLIVTEEFGAGTADSHEQAEDVTYPDHTPAKWDEGSVADEEDVEHHEQGQSNRSSAEVQDDAVNGNEIHEETKIRAHQSNETDNHDTHAITINYDGSEFWLFKQGENQDGDWLLEDPSLATKPFYDLFNACRMQLADDINGDTELGIRFDNFHALTIYEDSTACAVTTLEDLLDLYLNLHAQDGNADPESFYLTLQFRPRVVSLIGELRKAVQNQIGFSGWNDQITAGQTIFTTPYAADYQEPHDGPTTEDQDHVDQEDDENHSEEHDAEINHEDTESNESPTDESASRIATPAAQKHSPQSHSEDASDAEVHEEHEEDKVEDEIDYSDDEEEGPSDHAPTRESSAHGASTSSSTVDGDEVAGGEYDANHDSLDKNKVSENDEEESLEGEHDEQDSARDGDADANAYAQHDEGANANPNDDEEYPYDDLDREYGQNYSLDNTAQTYDNKEYPVDGLNQGGDSYYYDETNTAFYEQDGFGLSAGTDNQGEHVEQDNVADFSAEYDIAGVDDFLDLTGDADEANAQTYTTLDFDNEPQDGDHFDNEGTELQALVAASPTASPAIADSIGLEDLGSPQGLKRPIGEVDIGPVDSSDVTGAFSSNAEWLLSTLR